MRLRQQAINKKACKLMLKKQLPPVPNTSILPESDYLSEPYV